jgi:methionyl-tRNA synthetase
MDDIRPPKPFIKFDDFAKLDLRVARVITCAEHPNADKLLILQVDLGGVQRQICAGLKGFYRPEELVGKLVVIAVNLEPRSMRGQASQGLILLAKQPPSSPGDKERVIVISPAPDLPPGTPIS